MSRTDGNPNESWRAEESFWSRVAMEITHENKALIRKSLYTMWNNNRKGLRIEYDRVRNHVSGSVLGVEVCALNFYILYDKYLIVYNKL